MSRHAVNKGRSASKFRNNIGKTKGLNMAQAPMRGGWRI